MREKHGRLNRKKEQKGLRKIIDQEFEGKKSGQGSLLSNQTNKKFSKRYSRQKGIFDHFWI